MTMGMMPYWIMARKRKSKNQAKLSKTQNELMEVEPTSITDEDELMTIEAELITNQDELKTIEPESKTTHKELAMIPPTSTATHKELVRTRPTSTTTQKELIEMKNPSNIMTSLELQNEAGYVRYRDRLRRKTYATIVNKLEEYEEVKDNYSGITGKSVVQRVVTLMAVLDRISRWFNINDNNPKKEQRKYVLAKLRKQISDHLSLLVLSPEIQKKLDPGLVALLADGRYYGDSPTILFTYLMDKIISIYEVESIAPGNFKTEMRNFLIADNDVIGATSLATQTSGGSAGVRIAYDFFTLPCFSLGVEIDTTLEVAAVRLILSECQSELNNPNKFKRYCLMNMNGRAMEGKIGGKLKAVGQALPPFEGPSAEILEDVSLNFLLKVEASASAGADAKGVFLQVTEPTGPQHFDMMKEIDTDLFNLLTKRNQSYSRKLKKEATFFSLFSHGYGIHTEIGGEAGIGGGVQVGNNDVSASYGLIFKAKSGAGVYGNAKFTTYTYQNCLSNESNKVFKTQRTRMLLKQVYGATKAYHYVGAPIEAPQEDRNEKTRSRYDVVNSLSYQSGFVYWEKGRQQGEGEYKLSSKGLSGSARGHSLIAQQLNKYYQYTSADSEKKSRYLKCLAKQLKIDSRLIEDFLDKNRGIISDILTLQQAGHFLEATFVAPSDLNFRLDCIGEQSTNQPDSKVFDDLKNKSTTLQSLRFRTALQDKNNLYKPGFKLGFNIKVVKLGIDLGKVQEATSLKLTDYAIQWYDERGRTTNNKPSLYVPSSFLFL